MITCMIKASEHKLARLHFLNPILPNWVSENDIREVTLCGKWISNAGGFTLTEDVNVHVPTFNILVVQRKICAECLRRHEASEAIIAKRDFHQNGKSYVHLKV